LIRVEEIQGIAPSVVYLHGWFYAFCRHPSPNFFLHLFGCLERSMVDKHWDSQALINVSGPIGSLSDVLESEKRDALAVSCVKEDVLYPTFFTVMKFGVDQGKPEKVFVEVACRVEILC
tara:strand:+ start:412 stop:768 length:357 start_codon:yes stop_codon:yes gene_type:complete